MRIRKNILHVQPSFFINEFQHQYIWYNVFIKLSNQFWQKLVYKIIDYRINLNSFTMIYIEIFFQEIYFVLLLAKLETRSDMLI